MHASPESVHTRVALKADKKAKLAMFDNTARTGAFPGGGEPDVAGYGDIHISFLQNIKSKRRGALLLLNTGSVGLPYDGIPQASYTILEGILGGEEAAPFSVHSVRVPYDTEAAVRIAEKTGLPNLDRFAYEVRSGLEQ